MSLGVMRLLWSCADDNGRGGGGVVGDSDSDGGAPPCMPCLPLTAPMPALRCEPRVLSAALDVPPSCTVGTPAEVGLTLVNHSRAALGVAFVLGEARAFLASGPRRSRLMLLPGASARVAVTVVPVCAGFCALPAMSVLGGPDLRTPVLAPAEGPTVFVYPHGC